MCLVQISCQFCLTKVQYKILINQLLSVPYAIYAKTAETVSTGMTHYIGELFEGGIVVTVWKVDGTEHGLIDSLTDVSESATWSNITDVEIGITAQSQTDGQANTNAIIAQNGHTLSAASLCRGIMEVALMTGIFLQLGN